jgi:hypothetical protein
MDWLTDLFKPARTRVARRSERYRTTDLRSNLGLVADLSATGMRVRADAKPSYRRGDLLDVAVSNGEHRICVKARVVWIRKGAEGRYWVGVAFADPRPGIGQVMARLARFGYLEEPRPQSTAGPPHRQRSSTDSQVEDLYEILGVGRSASPDEIHNAYRRIAQISHPDVCSHPDAEERMSRVNKAYAVLRNPETRKKYDAMLRHSEAA